jgi:hypothetical protein
MSYSGLWEELEEIIRDNITFDIEEFESEDHPELSINEISDIISKSSDNIKSELIDCFMYSDFDGFGDLFKEALKILGHIKGSSQCQTSKELWKEMEECIMSSVREDWIEYWKE